VTKLKLKEIDLTGVLCPMTKKYHHHKKCDSCKYQYSQVVDENGRIYRVECTYNVEED